MLTLQETCTAMDLRVAQAMAPRWDISCPTCAQQYHSHAQQPNQVRSRALESARSHFALLGALLIDTAFHICF